MPSSHPEALQIRTGNPHWVQAIKAQAGPVFGGHTVRYDLCEVVGGIRVPAVTNVQRRSLTPLPEYRTPV
ncbi:hypothetical protein ABZT51_42385 [Streptomyces sp. NPDC005373]|uniref:hypothetical protein n=1 Tax=Streptomyces sp. NPDC005373 TaxID=3156879 RepID=UPI0033BB2A6A